MDRRALRHKFVWGWLRLILGTAQMVLSTMGVAALITIGVRPVTWALVLSASAAALLSRYLYRGKSSADGDPEGSQAALAEIAARESVASSPRGQKGRHRVPPP